MADNDIEDAIASFRTTTSGEEPTTPEPDPALTVEGDGFVVTSPAIGELQPGEPITGITASGVFIQGGYGVSVDDIVASEPQMSAPGMLFLEPSTVFAPHLPDLTVHSSESAAFVIHGEGKMIVQIHNDGTVELGPETTPDEAAQDFWDAVQLHGPNQLVQSLQADNTTLEARVKELEIKLGYRKDDQTEEDKGRFKEILDE